MKFLAAAAAMSMVPAIAQAQPVYLECMLTGMQWNVMLNAETAMVSWEFPANGRAYSGRGIFTADKVLFNGITISRSDLSITRPMDRQFYPQDDKGQCKLIEKKNAF